MADDIYAQRAQFYQKQRQNIDQGANAQEQSNQDVLNRRFAAIGQQGSGSAIQATMNSQRDVAAQKAQNQNALSGQESGELLQSAEAQKGRDFQANQADIQRQFEGGQATSQRDFQHGMQTEQLGQQQGQFNTDQQNKLKQMDLAERQFALDKDTTAFNENMASIQAGKTPPGLLGGTGFLGSGIGGQEGFLGTGAFSSKQPTSTGGKVAQIATAGLLGGGK